MIYMSEYEMKLVYLCDKQGNLVYPPPMFVEFHDQFNLGIRTMEISQLPLYVFMPIKKVTNDSSNDSSPNEEAL